MTERVSQAEAARHFGVSRQSFNELVARGVIPLFDGKIDLEVAAAIVKSRLDPSRSKILQVAGDRASAAPPPPSPPVDLPPPAAPAPPLALAPGEGLTSYHLARTLREKYAALDAKVRYEQLCGQLCEVDRVRLVLTTAAANLRLALDVVPDKLCTRFAAETDAELIRDLLRQAHDEALDALAGLDDALLARPADAA